MQVAMDRGDEVEERQSSLGRLRAEKHKMTKGLSDTKVHEARRTLYGSPFQSWISTSYIAATYW